MNKNKIINILEKIIPPSQIRNINIFGTEIIIDLNIDNPSLHAKKKLEKSIISSFEKHHKIIVNFNVEKKKLVLPNDNKNKLVGIDNVIAISSGKGGVGKSTTAVNLALALKEEGANAAILDADIYGPSIPRMLGVSGQPDSEDGKTLQPKIGHGLQSMSIGLLVEEDTPMIWRGPMVTQALEQLLTDTQWKDVDYLIIDLPPGTGDVQLTLCQKIPVSGAVIVTTPQDISLIDARKGLKMFEKVEVPVLGIVENMSTHVCKKCGHIESIFGEGGGEQLASEAGVKLLGELPLEKQIREEMDKGTPTVSSNPMDPASLAYREIARKMTATLSMRKKDYSAAFPKIVIQND